MDLPSYLQARDDGAQLSVKLQPRASKNEIGPVLGHELKIKVTAAPVDSSANEALLGFLADTLDCPRRAVQLIQGLTSRHKTILISGLTPATVAAQLGRHSKRT